jgi:RimJ/RimL family protein N-acetyltransferase
VNEPRLETERLILRVPRLGDAAAAAEMLGDPEVMKFLGGSTVSAEDAPAVVEKWLERWERHGVGPFVLEHGKDRGNGYATEAARAVRDWARSERGVGHLISLIVPDNLASQRVAERLGAGPTETVSLSDSGDAVVWVHPR